MMQKPRYTTQEEQKWWRYCKKRSLYVLSLHIYFLYNIPRGRIVSFLDRGETKREKGRENIENLRKEELGKLDMQARDGCKKKKCMKWGKAKENDLLGFKSHVQCSWDSNLMFYSG